MVDRCVTLQEAENAMHTMASFLLKPSNDALLHSSLCSTSDAHEDSTLSIRQSESSMNSEEDLEGSITSLYSEEELMTLDRYLVRLYDKFFTERSIECIPTSYYEVMDSLLPLLKQELIYDSNLIDLISTLLVCIQIRLFSSILNYQYHYFVITDLFEYLVNEIRSPSLTQLPFALFRRETQYSLERLESCEAEIPHLRSFIQGNRYSFLFLRVY